jgi:hypothetical protein
VAASVCWRAGASRGPLGSRCGSRSSRSRISRRQQLRARRRQLDRERQPVEPAADAGYLRRARSVELEAGVDRAGAGREEPQRIGLDERLER